MNPIEVKKAIFEALETLNSQPTYHPQRMEFSKKLILGASFFYGLMCVVALISWFVLGEWPREIIEHFSWPFAGLGVSYMAKTAYENKAKIQGGDK